MSKREANPTEVSRNNDPIQQATNPPVEVLWKSVGGVASDLRMTIWYIPQIKLAAHPRLGPRLVSEANMIVVEVAANQTWVRSPDRTGVFFLGWT